MGFKTDLTDSAREFMRLVRPKLRKLGYISGKIVPIESVTATGTTRDLDVLAGIDAWNVDTKKGMQGIASRIQWGDTPYNSFTVRKSRTSGAETEYAKRKSAMKDGEWLYPIWTVQAYISAKRDGKLLSLGVAKTRAIFNAIADERCTTKSNSWDGNTFIVVYWKDVRGVKIWEA